MKAILPLLFSVLFSAATAQDIGHAIDFNQLQCVDNANKIFVDLKAKTPEDVVLLEKDYIVSSDRVKAINARFTSEELASGRIITVAHSGMKDFSEEWLKLIKVLINDSEVLKLREYEEEKFQMLVSSAFSFKDLEKIASKANWNLQLIGE